MSEENVELVKQGYVAFREAWTTKERAPYEAWVRDVVSPEFEYIPSGNLPGGPTGRLNVGEFLRFLDTFWEEFEVLLAEPSEEILDAGNSVLARINFRGRGRRSGVEVSLDEFHLWTFRGRKVIRGQAFGNRAKALEAAGLSE